MCASSFTIITQTLVSRIKISKIYATNNATLCNSAFHSHLCFPVFKNLYSLYVVGPQRNFQISQYLRRR